MLLGLLALLLSMASVAGAAPLAYISNSSQGVGRVSIIDADPNAVCPVAGETPPCVVKILQVGRSPGGIAVNPAGTLAYVANAGDGTVSVIRTSANGTLNSVVASIPVGFGPWGVAVSADNSTVYVGLANGSVAVIDVNNGNAVATIANVGGVLNGLVVAGSRVFVSDATSGQVVVIDGPTRSVIRRIDIGTPPNSSPLGIVANPSGTRVYVPDLAFDQVNLINVLEVSVIDTSLVDNLMQNPVIQTMVIDPDPVPQMPENTLATPGGIAMSSDGSLLYVTNDGLDEVTIITLSDGSRARVAVGTNPVGLATDPTGRAYVANLAARTVSVLDPSNALVKNIPIGGMPFVFGAFATAGPPRLALTLMTVGGGTITPQPAPVAGKYDAGTVVTLTATPDAGSQFTSWSGDCSGTSTTCTVTMDAARSVTATFTPLYTLYITVLGNGTVEQAPMPTAGKYLAGTLVTLTAKPAADSVFTGWTSCPGASGVTCNLTMDAAKSLTATFTAAQYTLSLSKVGAGTITAEPPSATGKYNAGAVVTLTATPDPGFQFTGWANSNPCSGTDACAVVMNGNHSETATFTALPPPPPPPAPTTCDDRIKDLEQKVAADKHPWRHDHQLKAALRLHASAKVELGKAKAKVGENDKRYVRALKEFNNGKAALCNGRYWHAHHELWESYYIAHEILKHRR